MCSGMACFSYLQRGVFCKHLPHLQLKRFPKGPGNWFLDLGGGGRYQLCCEGKEMNLIIPIGCFLIPALYTSLDTPSSAKRQDQFIKSLQCIFLACVRM